MNRSQRFDELLHSRLAAQQEKISGHPSTDMLAALAERRLLAREQSLV